MLLLGKYNASLTLWLGAMILSFHISLFPYDVVKMVI